MNIKLPFLISLVCLCKQKAFNGIILIDRQMSGSTESHFQHCIICLLLIFVLKAFKNDMWLDTPGHVLLQWSDIVANLLANGCAAFNESCTAIG